MLTININDVAEGEMKGFEVGHKSVLVAKLDGRIYAIKNICTHLGCRLSEGSINGKIVTCPCHGTQFDLTTGKMVAGVTKWPKIIGKLISPIIKDETKYSSVIVGDQVTITDDSSR